MVLNLVTYDNNIKLLSNLGVILLMFLAGLETNLAEFKKAGLSAFFIAVAGITVPLIFGTLTAYLFFQNFWENVFIGVILTATSVSITVETLAELGKLNTRVGINILGAAVIAILFLPKLLNKLLKDVQPTRTFLTFSIAAALLAAFAAESLGIAAITGAYLCGLLLSQFVHKEALERGLKPISSGFLSPIFFASVGIETNLDGFSMKTLTITLCMFMVAVIGKILGCGGAARAFRMSRSEASQVGIGMVSRGEVAIITANIGLQAGIITNEVFLPTIVVVILTTVITPVLLKLSFSHKYEKVAKKQHNRI
jgi:Kef-type K+ transport system membrane component KefB